ncbi:serine protease [Microcoleus sp. D2_18a_D3]|uniref:serine protease n=1 Tax=Microcoleus sp. D2_18a_D3 TaxID=3055330 RepID=UPI002FD0128C
MKLFSHYTGQRKIHSLKSVKHWKILAISLLLTGILNGLARETTEKLSAASPNISEQVNQPVYEIANLVTVRIFSESASGSGVIIQHQGQAYTVLTNDHVVVDRKEHNYRVLTADGKTHIAKLLPSYQLGNLDLALVQFTSYQSYRVAEIGNSHQLSIGSAVFATGFPNWHWIKSNSIENTRNWGRKAFQFTSGQVEMLPDRSLGNGYQLGYSNDIVDGMSGGPVLNNDGKLVGINGRSKYPLGGIEVFRFADGSLPSQAVFQQMEALSWAIPIGTFERVNYQDIEPGFFLGFSLLNSYLL